MTKTKSNRNINESTSKRSILKNMKKRSIMALTIGPSTKRSKRSIMALEQLDCQQKGARGASWLWDI
jgi:hypothetical protein